MSTVFPSKVDGWIVIFTVGVPLVPLIVIAKSVLLASETLIASLIVFFILIGILWLLLGTYYVVNEGVLIAHSGPFRWRIQLASVTDIEESHDFRSAPALSLDRLKISYGDGRSILVYPKDKTGFLREINYARSNSMLI